MAGPIQLVQVKIELGHKATFRKKPTAEGFTHDWQVFVKGPGRCEIHHFIEKVVFHLHESFPKPKRVVKEAPYQVSESGYAGFNLPIEIYFKNKEEPKKLGFSYDLFLQAPGAPPVNHCRCEKLTFQNPTEQFKEKLLKAGGVCSRKHEPNQNDVDPVGDGKSKKSSSSKSTVKSESSRNNQSDSQAEAAMSKPFADLFGPPIRTESKKTKSNGSVKDKTKAKSYTSTCSGNVAHKEPKYLGSSSNVSSKEKQHTKDGLSHQKRPSEESPADEHVNKKIKISTSSNDSKDEKLCSSEKDYSKVRNKEKTKEKHRDKSRERERKHKSKNRERGHSSKDKDERSRSDKKEKHVDSLSKEDNFKCSSTEKAEMKLSVSDLDFDDFNDSNSPLDIGSGTSSMTAINSLMADPENDDDDGGGGGDVGGDDDEIFISSLSSPQHSAECSPLKGKLMKKSVSKSKLESINVSVEKIKLCSESGKSLAKKSKEHKKLKETKKCKDSSKDHKDSKDQRDKENRELKPKEQKEREIKDLKVKEEKDVRVQKDRDSKEQKDTGGNREQNVKDNKKERESKERREKDLKNEKHLKKKEKKEQKKESKKIKDQKENKKDEKQKELKKDRENRDEKEKDGKKGKEDKEQKDKEGREQKEVKRDPENIEKSCMDQDETINTKLEHRNSLDVIDVDSSDEKEIRSVESNEVESLKGAELSVENKEQKCKKNKSSERKESREPDESKGRRKRLREDIKELESKELKSKEKLKKEKKHKDREKLKEHKFIKDRQKSAKERDQYKFSKSKEHKTEIESKKEHKTEVESKLAKQNWDCRSDQINNILAGDSVKSNSNSPIFDLDIVVPPVDSSSFSPLNKDASLREELMEDQSHCMKLVSPLEDTKTFSFEQCPNNSKEDAEERAENGVSVIALQDLMEKINRTTNSAFMQSVVDLVAGTGLCNLENGFIHCDLALVNDKIIQKLRSLTE